MKIVTLATLGLLTTSAAHAYSRCENYEESKDVSKLVIETTDPSASEATVRLHWEYKNGTTRDEEVRRVTFRSAGWDIYESDFITYAGDYSLKLSRDASRIVDRSKGLSMILECL